MWRANIKKWRNVDVCFKKNKIIYIFKGCDKIKFFVCYNLKFNDFAIKLECADFEVDTDGADVCVAVCVIGKSQ